MKKKQKASFKKAIAFTILLIIVVLMIIFLKLPSDTQNNCRQMCVGAFDNNQVVDTGSSQCDCEKTIDDKICYVDLITNEGGCI